MKQVLFFMIFSNISIFSQSCKIGGTVDYGFPNDNWEYQIGPSLMFETLFEQVPVSVQFYARVLLGEGTIWSHTRSLGAGLKYSPFKDLNVLPYIMASLFLNGYGTTSQDVVGRDIHVSSIEKNMSEEVALGFLLNPKKSNMNIVFEIAYKISSPKYKYYLVRYDQTKILTDKYDFNTIYCKIGFWFASY